MPPNSYRRERNLEYEVKRIFEAEGWSVIRGSGSKGEVAGFPTDLVASKSSPHSEKTVYILVMQAKLKGR